VGATLFIAHRAITHGSLEGFEMIHWLKRKVTAVTLSGVATIQVLQITILPTWLDIVTNLVILGGVGLVGYINKDTR
jgi:hypothetical protein